MYGGRKQPQLEGRQKKKHPLNLPRDQPHKNNKNTPPTHNLFPPQTKPRFSFFSFLEERRAPVWGCCSILFLSKCGVIATPPFPRKPHRNNSKPDKTTKNRPVVPGMQVWGGGGLPSTGPLSRGWLFGWLPSFPCSPGGQKPVHVKRPQRKNGPTPQ